MSVRLSRRLLIPICACVLMGLVATLLALNRSPRAALRTQPHTGAQRGWDGLPATEKAEAEDRRNPDSRAGVVRGRFLHDSGTTEFLDGGAVTETASLRRGAFVLSYRRSPSSGWRVRFHVPGFRPREYLLASQDQDLGDVELEQATVYGGRVLGPDQAPLSQVVVEYRQPTGTPATLLGASRPTEIDGRYEIAFAILPTFATAANRLQNGRLYVLRDGRCMGEFAATTKGLTQQHDLILSAQGIDHPRVRVVGAGDIGIPGVTVTVHAGECDMARASLGACVGRAATDDAGEAVVPWPPWLARAVVVLEHQSFSAPVHVYYTGRFTDVQVLSIESVQILDVTILWAEDQAPARDVPFALLGTWQHARVLQAGDEPRLPAEGDAAVIAGRTSQNGTCTCAFIIPGPTGNGPFMLDVWGACYPWKGARTLEWHDLLPEERVSGPRLPPLLLEGKQPGEPRFLALSIEDTSGPVLPQRVAIMYHKGGAVAFSETPDLTDDGSNPPRWFAQLTRAGLSALRDDWGADQVTVAVEPSGQPWRFMSVGWTEFRECWQTERTLRVTLMDRSVRGRVQVLGCDGAPVPYALVSLAPADTRFARGPQLTRVSAGLGGTATVSGLDPAVGYVVHAVDPESGAAGSVQTHWTEGQDVVVRLETPVDLRFHVVFPDGTPAKEGVAVRCFANADTRPPGLLPSVNVSADADGMIVLPAIVPSLLDVRIEAYDKRWAGPPPNAPSTHKKTLRADAIPPDGAVRLDPR